MDRVTDRITFSTPKRKVRENSAIVVSARFRDSGADQTPTNINYRLDDPDTGRQITGWTSISAANPASITLTPTENKAQNCRPRERRQLTVAANYGLSTQFVETFDYEIENVLGVT